MIRNVAVNISTWSNKDIIPHRDVTDDGCIDAYPYTVSDGRSPLAHTSVLLTYGYAFMYVAVAPNHSARINGDVKRMA